MLGNAGLSWPQALYMEIAMSIYVSAESNGLVARKIIAHELGHMNLGHVIPLAWSTADTIIRDPQENSEVQADQYGFELLMPVDGVKNCKDYREVARVFVVEEQVALSRWHSLKLEKLI